MEVALVLAVFGIKVRVDAMKITNSVIALFAET